MSEPLRKAAEVEAALAGAHDARAEVARELAANPAESAPPSRASKRKKPTPTAAPPRAPAKIAKYLPDAERVKVFKRDLGQRHYLRQYTPRDLAHAADIETFIQHHLVPVYGEGEYDVDVLTADGKLSRTVPVSVMDPRKAPPGIPPSDGTLAPVVDKLLARLDQLEREARVPARSLTEQLEEMARVQEMIGGGGDQTALLWMLQQQQQAHGSRHEELAELRAEVRRLREQPPAAAAPLPPLPSSQPEPLDIAAIIREATAAAKPALDVAQLAELLAPRRSGLEDMVGAVTALAPIIERVLGPRSTELEQMRQQQMELLREQVRDLRAASPARGVKDILDEMGAVREFVRQAGGGSRERRDESFWSFLRDLVGQLPTTMQSIGTVVDRIRAEDGASPGPTPVAQLAGTSGPPPFPDGFDAQVRAIAEATDDAGRIGAALLAFQALGAHPAWRAYLQQAMASARAGKTREALGFMTQFLRGLADSGRLDPAVAAAATRAFETHAERVLEALGGKRS